MWYQFSTNAEYIHSHGDSVCNTQNWVSTDDQFDVTNSAQYVDDSGNVSDPSKWSGHATFVNDSSEARMKIYLKGMAMRTPMDVLATDYENYAFMFSCTQVGLDTFEVCQLLVKDPKVEESVFADLARDAYAKVNFDYDADFV